MLFKFAFCQISSDIFTDSISKILYNNPDKAIKISNQFLKISKSKNLTKDIIKSYSALGIAYEVKNRTDSTLYYYFKALNLSKDPESIIQFKYSIAGIYEGVGIYDDALEFYNQALELSKNINRDDSVDKIKNRIAIVKVKLTDSPEAIDVLRKIYENRKRNNDIDLKFARKVLIEAYQNNKKYKIADSLIAEGTNEAKETLNDEFMYYMKFLQANSYFLQSNFERSKSSIEESLLYATELKNDEFINESNYLIAKVLLKENKYQEAKKIIKQAIYNSSNKTDIQLSNYYKLLADIFKKTDSLDLSNLYLEKHIKQREIVSSKRLNALERIHDISINEKELESKKQSKTKWLLITISVILLLTILIIIWLFRDKSKQNQKRFENLMIKIKEYEERKEEENLNRKDLEVLNSNDLVEKFESENEILDSDIKQEEDEENEEEESTFVIDDKKVEEILSKIQVLEDKMYFLRQDCTLHNMAKKLKTNTSYLSKIINNHLDKTFSTYINELRINYAIIELKNNKRLRSYSVKGIAQEMGYKNADAFSRYFRSATGISPSVYIKKIKDI